jgi:hypothetical protein
MLARAQHPSHSAKRTLEGIMTGLRKPVQQTLRFLQCDQLRRDLIQWDHLSFRLCTDIIAIPHVDRLAIQLFLTDNCKADTI